MRNTFIETLIKTHSSHKDFFMLSGDAGLGLFEGLQKQYPNKFKNMGIAEQNAIGFAAGMGLVGFKVYVYNIIPFVLYRCYEQVRNDICYQNIPVVLIGVGSGVTYAPAGMTHYSVEDLALARTLPNLKIISPIDPIEARLAAEYSFTSDSPTYIRLAKRGEPNIHEREKFDITKPQLIKDGKEVAIVFHGSIADDVMKAAEILKSKNIRPKLISIPMLQPLDFGSLCKMTDDVKHVVVVEEHFENSGLGNILMQACMATTVAWKLHVMGIPYGFIHAVHSITGLRKRFGLSAEHIVDNVMRLEKK